MNKNTLKAINRRLAKGLKDFRIGENSYHLNTSGRLWHYDCWLGGCPVPDGIVVNGRLNPYEAFTTEEKERAKLSR